MELNITLAKWDLMGDFFSQMTPLTGLFRHSTDPRTVVLSLRDGPVNGLQDKCEGSQENSFLALLKNTFTAKVIKAIQ